MTGGWGAVTLPHRLPVGRMPELAQEARRRHLGRWISGHVCLRQVWIDWGQRLNPQRTQPSEENGRVVGDRHLWKSSHWKMGPSVTTGRVVVSRCSIDLLKSSRSAAETHI